MDEEPKIELLSLALVREYLSRKGFKSTLYAFDKESGKKNDSIQNRKILAEKLKILDLVQSNKVLGGAKRFQSFLEMIILYLVTVRDTSLHKRRSSGALKVISSTAIGNNENDDDTATAHSNFINSSTRNHSSGSSISKRNETVSSSRKRRSCKDSKRLFETSDKDILKENCFVEKLATSTNNNTTIMNNSLDSSGSFMACVRKEKEAKEVQQPSTTRTVEEDTSRLSQKIPKKKLELLDIDNMDDDVIVDQVSNNSIATGPPTTSLHTEIVDITFNVAVELKTLIFGNATTSFNNEWSRHGFYFSKHPSLKFGLMQEKGGPCGLLASVQAWVLKVLIFDEENVSSINNGPPLPSIEEQNKALTNAFVEILWRARSITTTTNNHCTVAFPSRSAKFNAPQGKYKTDSVTEKLDLYKFNNRNHLQAFLKKNLTIFRAEYGLVLFLYSAILSRGISNIRNDMDESLSGTLIGCHGYCTQEMVNLLLIGRAVSNVFDGDKILGDEDDDDSAKMILHGVHSQSHIGFLSLFEHYNSCQVGQHYKTPKHPIWVVCSESHFSVLFATCRIPDAPKRVFDLYYFDGLGQQDEEIRLSITPGGLSEMLNEDKCLVPPLDSCIRTKWTNAAVDWNDTDPLL